MMDTTAVVEEVAKKESPSPKVQPAKTKSRRKVIKLIRLNTQKCNIRNRILNTNLKFAISNCRGLLECQLRKTNLMMKNKINDWITREGTNVNFNTTFDEEAAVSFENERMRQALSDFLNGPLSSFLQKSERVKLLKMCIPTIPNNKNNTPRREEDFFRAYDSETSLDRKLFDEPKLSVKNSVKNKKETESTV